MPANQPRSVSAQARWGTRLPFSLPLGPILSENIYVCCIGHAFGEMPPHLTRGPNRYFVQDFLLDQSQSTGGDSFLEDPIQFDLTQSSGYMYQISASCGKRVHVNLRDNMYSASFSLWLGRQVANPPSGGFFSQMPAQVNFQGLIGTTPALTYNSFFITQGDNSALMFEIEAELTTSFSFEGINLRADFSRAFDPGAKWYNPLSYGVPFGTKDIYPNSETYVLFSYQTADPIDPGPFVTLDHHHR